ncbi:hypothetical protein SteCoe_6808 [Stentor coeruleus]|uniref:PHD-type domain-containing protein n=1 Tax=Stentor coeruleus TaxID=5963 RepID=A0A1R2CNZ7_9CILI|nr:hypothetical protein SteCoe_6808 [Stentor coeruleus]
MEHTKSYFTGFDEITLINHAPFKLLAREDPNSQIFGNKDKCEVCNEDSAILLMTCSICGINVHNYCYDMQAFFSPWTCQACIFTLLMKESVKCIICDSYSGALRKYSQGWMHIICVKWPKIETKIAKPCGNCKILDSNITKCEDCSACFHPFCGYQYGMRKVSGHIKCELHCVCDKKLENKQAKVLVTEDPSGKLLIVEPVFNRTSDKLLKKPKVEDTVNQDYIKKISKGNDMKNYTKPKIEELNDKINKRSKLENKQRITKFKFFLGNVLRNFFWVICCDDNSSGNEIEIIHNDELEKEMIESKLLSKSINDNSIEENIIKIYGKPWGKPNLEADLIKIMKRQKTTESIAKPQKRMKIEEDDKECKKHNNEGDRRERKIKGNKQKYVQKELNYSPFSDKECFYSFKSPFIKEISFKKKCLKVELSNKFEDFLFQNSKIKKSSYELPDRLKKIFNRDEIFFKEFPDIVLEYSEVVS